MFFLTLPLPWVKFKCLKWIFLLKSLAPSFLICISLSWESCLERTKEKKGTVSDNRDGREKGAGLFLSSLCVPSRAPVKFWRVRFPLRHTVSGMWGRASDRCYYVYMYVYVCVHMCVCTHIHTYIYMTLTTNFPNLGRKMSIGCKKFKGPS